MERFKVHVAVQLVLIKDGKVLLLRRANTGFEDGNYGLPSGHIDGGESVRQAMVREAKEEAMIDIDPDALKFLHVTHRLKPDGEWVDFFFTLDKWVGEIGIGEPHKCDDLSWFDFNSLPENMVDYIRDVLSMIKDNKTFSEFGWN